MDSLFYIISWGHQGHLLLCTAKTANNLECQKAKILGNSLIYMLLCHFYQGRQILWIPVCFPGWHILQKWSLLFKQFVVSKFFPVKIEPHWKAIQEGNGTVLVLKIYQFPKLLIPQKKTIICLYDVEEMSQKKTAVPNQKVPEGASYRQARHSSLWNFCFTYWYVKSADSSSRIVTIIGKYVSININ